MNKIMKQGEFKVVKHFDMVKIVKNLRDLKHVVIHHLGRQADGRDKEVYLQQVAQNPKRVIQEEYNDTEAQII